jgi:hypothetical protein
MAFLRGIDDSDSLRWEPVTRGAGAQEEERRTARSGRLGTGTLACGRCDAPVALAGAPVSPADPISCPYCGHGARVRDFLSLATPSRPARVEVRVVQPAFYGRSVDLPARTR